MLTFRSACLLLQICLALFLCMKHKTRQLLKRCLLSLPCCCSQPSTIQLPYLKYRTLPTHSEVVAFSLVGCYWSVLAPPFCWTKFPKIVAKLKRSFRNFLRNLLRNSPRNVSCFPGRYKSPPTKFHQIFPIGDFKFQIEFQIKFHQKFHKQTSAGLAALKVWGVWVCARLPMSLLQILFIIFWFDTLNFYRLWERIALSVNGWPSLQYCRYRVVCFCDVCRSSL